MRALFIVIVCLSVAQQVTSFMVNRQYTTTTLTELLAGRGMGMAASTKKKGEGKTKKKNGMGKKSGGGSRNSSVSSGTSFDVSSSMIRLGKRYDELLLASAKQIAKQDDDTPSIGADDDDGKITAEYVVAARSISKGTSGVRDWIPFAQLCLVRPESEYDHAKDVIQAAISFYCRELSHSASFGAPIFSSVARNELQYSVEPIESFYKYVYESVIEGGADQDMTKSVARETLGLANDESDKTLIKQAYRKLSFDLHPDRFEGSTEECENASERFSKVKLAYETLSSGVRQDGVSWYESLGGRSRTEFMGPIDLLPLAAAQEQMARRKAEAGIVGLDHDLIQTFLARNLRSAF